MSSEISIDSFVTPIPFDQLVVLLELGREYSFDPLSSTEMERYFVELLAQFNGQQDDLKKWIEPNVRQAFRSVSLPPRWTQGPQWPLFDNRPMLFIGQIDCDVAVGLLPGQAVFFVFFDPPSGERKTVLQLG